MVHVPLFGADTETLKAVAIRSGLTKKLRDVLDTYEAKFQLEIATAAAGVGAGAGFSFGPPTRDLIDAISSQIVTRAEKIADKAAAKKVNTIVAEGDPPDVMLDQAAKNKADTIVKGSRGLSDFKGLLLGSISHKISSRSNCSCITVQ